MDSMLRPRRPSGRGASRRSTALTVAGVAAACVGLSGCSGSATAQAGVDWFAPGQRQLAGEVSGPTLDGRSLSLASLRGHVVVVNFWASSCGPCRTEQSTLDEVQRAEAGSGVKFVGIDYRDTSVADARAFLRSHPANYPSIVDETGTTALRFPGAQPQTTPTTLILTPQGRIAARVNGSILFTRLRALVDRVVAESA